MLIDFTPFRKTTGELDYGYVSGAMEFDFLPGMTGTTREAVGPMVLAQAASATIPAGTTIKAYDNSAWDPVSISISGQLTVNGLLANPVAFVGPGTTPQRGSWQGIVFDTNSANSVLKHFSVAHAVQAIFATDTNISIENALIDLPTEAGIVLDGVSDDSEVVNSVINGVVDPLANPPVFLKTTAQSHIVGIQIIDSYSSACQAPGTCGAISGNTIRGLVTGIHVVGTSFPEIIGNTIEDNIWGIWLQATTAGEPLPRIRQNTIAVNSGDPPLMPIVNFLIPQFRFCSTLTGSNLCFSDYELPPGASAVVDATENYWGTEDPTEVRNTVHFAEGQRVSADVSRFRNSAGAIVGPASGLFSALLVDISRTGHASLLNAVIRPFGGSPLLNIELRLVDTAAVTLQIYPEGNTSGIPLYSTSYGTLSIGTYSRTWDAKDSSENFVPDGAYAFVLTATSASVVDRYDPERNAGEFQEGEGSSPDLALIGDRGYGDEVATLPTVDGQFNSFEGDYLTANYTLKELAARGKPFASYVSAEVKLRTSPNDACDLVSGVGKRVARPWRGKAVYIGAPHNFLWDGRADEFVDPTSGYSAGQVVADPMMFSGSNQIPGFCVFFLVPAALRPNHVIVDRTMPRIQRPTPNGAEVEVLSDPFLIHPSYEQSTTIKFKVLDRPSFVKLHILPPGAVDLSAAVSTREIDGNVSLPGIQSVPVNQLVAYEWKVHPDNPGDTNLLETASSGAYTFALEATPDGSPNLTTIYRGVVQVLGQ